LLASSPNRITTVCSTHCLQAAHLCLTHVCVTQCSQVSPSSLCLCFHMYTRSCAHVLTAVGSSNGAFVRLQHVCCKGWAPKTSCRTLEAHMIWLTHTQHTPDHTPHAGTHTHTHTCSHHNQHAHTCTHTQSGRLPAAARSVRSCRNQEYASYRVHRELELEPVLPPHELLITRTPCSYR